MGPIALVDKSFLQALNSEQLKAFHRHYSILVTPILLEEILGNLVKSKYTPDEALSRVIDLATRTSALSTFTVPDFRAMSLMDMLGQKIPMTGQIPAFGPKKVVAADGSVGFEVDETFEKKLLRNWRAGEFSEKDRKFAGNLAKEVESYDLPGTQKEMQELFPSNKTAKSLEDIKEKLRRASERRDNWPLIESHVNYCRASSDESERIKLRWNDLGKPRFKEFAPYAHYCSEVMGVYFVGITAELIKSSTKAKTLIDMIYFHYLPFSQVFISSDNFHKMFFPLFARSGQSFLWGEDLKPDLEQIASFHKNLNDNDRLQFEREFGNYPPPIPGSLTKGTWERHMRPWTPGSGNKVAGLSVEERRRQAKELFEKLGIKD